MLPLYKNLTPTKDDKFIDRNKFSVTAALSDKDIDDSILGGDKSTITVGGIRQRKTKLTVLSGSDDAQGPSLRSLDKLPSKRRAKVQSNSKFKNLVEWIMDTFKVFSLFLLLLAGLYITLRADFSRSTSTSIASPATTSVVSAPNDTTATPKLMNKLKDPKRIASQFKCKDGIGVGIFNDDYCDCSDGSDEPYTSACSNLLVQNASYPCSHGLINKGNLALRIYPSRIKDGVIDCPDGSDEIVMTS
jgi:hypothetical protein